MRRDGQESRSPWHAGHFNRTPPNTLRVAMLDVCYLGLSRIREIAACRRPSLLRECAVWRLTSPEQFVELCGLLQIDPVAITPRESRRHGEVPLLDVYRPAVVAREAATICGVSVRTMWNWVRAQHVQYGRTPSGSIRIYADSLVVRAPRPVTSAA